MLRVLLVQNTKDRQHVVILMPLKTDTIYWFLKKTKTTCCHKKDTQDTVTQQKEIECANEEKKTPQPKEI